VCCEGKGGLKVIRGIYGEKKAVLSVKGLIRKGKGNNIFRGFGGRNAEAGGVTEEKGTRVTRNPCGWSGGGAHRVWDCEVWGAGAKKGGARRVEGFRETKTKNHLPYFYRKASNRQGVICGLEKIPNGDAVDADGWD